LQPLTVYNKVDGLYYEYRDYYWYPVAAPDAHGVMTPIDGSAWTVIPLAGVSDDTFVFPSGPSATAFEPETSYIHNDASFGLATAPTSLAQHIR